MMKINDVYLRGSRKEKNICRRLLIRLSDSLKKEMCSVRSKAELHLQSDEERELHFEIKLSALLHMTDVAIGHHLVSILHFMLLVSDEKSN